MSLSLPPRVTATINAAALKHNLARVRECAPNAKVMAVLKADAYGHGLENVANVLQENVDAFAVATVEELERLKKLTAATGPELHVAVLSGIFSKEVLEHVIRLGGTPAVHNTSQLEWLLASSEKEKLENVWIKMDSGMHRQGLLAEEFIEAYNAIRRKLPSVNMRLMSHFANADDCSDDYTDKQIIAFTKATRAFDCEKAMGNSPAILRGKGGVFDWVRPGLMLYGASPVQGKSAAELGLKPVMSLNAKLLSIKHVAKGEPVGYGGAWKAPRDSRLGVVACGYGDGYPRVVSENAYVVINDERAGLCGRVSMDVMSVDLTDVKNANVGDEVELWGHKLPVDEVAVWANTISYELLCKITSRVPRVLA